MYYFGKLLVVVGIIFIAVGLVFVFMPKIPYLGRLPGDICIKKENFSFYFPLTTCIILSILISFVLWLISRK